MGSHDVDLLTHTTSIVTALFGDGRCTDGTPGSFIEIAAYL